MTEARTGTMELIRLVDDTLRATMRVYSEFRARAADPGGKGRERRIARTAEHAVWAVTDLSADLLTAAREEGLVYLSQPDKPPVPPLAVIPGGKGDPPDRPPPPRRARRGKGEEPVVIEDLVKFGEDRGFKRGLKRGLKKGELRAERSRLRRVLALRRIELTAEQEQQIKSCKDLATLRRWLDQAIFAESAAEALM